MNQTLSDLIARVESNRNRYAVRYEPAFKPSPASMEYMAALCKCSRATAAALCAMSWGYYQIMGESLARYGLKVTPMEYCANDALQLETFNRFVDGRAINYTVSEIRDDHFKRERFALRYNGPGNIAAYSARLLACMV